MVVLSLYVPWHWVSPQPFHFALMIAIGGIAAGGHFLLIRAFDYAEASLLAPFGYGEIVTATLIGYVGFGDFPDSVTWFGMAVILGSGVYIALREREIHLDVPPDEGRMVG